MISADGKPLPPGQTCYIRTGGRLDSGLWIIRTMTVSGHNKSSVRLEPTEPGIKGCTRTPSKIWVNRLIARGASA
jgi:hypothetical protein